MSITLARLFAVAGAGVSTFSFSSNSLGAGLSLIFLLDANIFIRVCSNVALDALRWMLGVGVPGLDDEDRASEDGNLVLVGVGVPMEVRLVLGGGGPIEPVNDLVEVKPEATPFARTLLPKIFVPVAGVSNPRMLSLPVSDNADGGLMIPGVENAVESRRCAIFDG
jgi:hypothetical protein